MRSVSSAIRSGSSLGSPAIRLAEVSLLLRTVLLGTLRETEFRTTATGDACLTISPVASRPSSVRWHRRFTCAKRRWWVRFPLPSPILPRPTPPWATAANFQPPRGGWLFYSLGFLGGVQPSLSKRQVIPISPARCTVSDLRFEVWTSCIQSSISII